MKRWIGEDARILHISIEFFKKMKNEMKRSYTLTKTQAANHRGLGVRFKNPEQSAKVYPSIPATLEETVEPGSNRTVTWVQDTKPTANKRVNERVKTENGSNNDALGQPPDCSQLMGRQQYTPQHNPQTQYGFQSLNAGQYQYSFPVFNQQCP